MSDIELNARRIAKVILFNRVGLEKLAETQGAEAFGAALGRTPAIQQIAETMTEAEVEAAIRRALEMIYRREVW